MNQNSQDKNSENKSSVHTTAKNATVPGKYLHFVPEAPERPFQTQWSNSKPKCPEKGHRQPCPRSPTPFPLQNKLKTAKSPWKWKKMSTRQTEPKGEDKEPKSSWKKMMIRENDGFGLNVRGLCDCFFFFFCEGSTTRKNQKQRKFVREYGRKDWID